MSEKANVWTIEELIESTEEVQKASVKYRGKDFNFQYCELTEKEEPNLKALPKTATDQEQQDWATETGTERILAMIQKANDKNPDKATITSDNWSDIPLTLRYQITSEILSYQQEATENFTTG
jgi:cation transport ATPase